MNRHVHRLDRSFGAYKLVPGAALSVMLALVPGVLCAQLRPATRPEVAAVTVPLGDLNLATPEGARAAHDRLAAAARRVCNKFSDTRRISNAETLSDCTRDTLNDALHRLNSNLVAAAKEPNRN